MPFDLILNHIPDSFGQKVWENFKDLVHAISLNANKIPKVDLQILSIHGALYFFHERLSKIDHSSEPLVNYDPKHVNDKIFEARLVILDKSLQFVGIWVFRVQIVSILKRLLFNAFFYTFMKHFGYFIEHSEWKFAVIFVPDLNKFKHFWRLILHNCLLCVQYAFRVRGS